MDKTQIAFEKAVLDALRNLSDGAGLSFYNIFKAGYDYAVEELEKNRLIACDNMTEEEAEREQRFVINFLAKNSRTPTFSDCIEVTRQEMIDKACKHINDHWDKLLVYDYNQYGGCVFNRQKTVEQFKQAMEE